MKKELLKIDNNVNAYVIVGHIPPALCILCPKQMLHRGWLHRGSKRL